MEVLRRNLLRVADRRQLGGEQCQERLRGADAPRAEEVPQDRGGLLERVGVRCLGEGRPFDGTQEQGFSLVGRRLAVDDGWKGVFEWGQDLFSEKRNVSVRSYASKVRLRHTSKAF